MIECGAELKIYNEVGGWEDSITCHLDKGHVGQHEGTHAWNTDEQFEAEFNLTMRRVKAQKKKAKP